jgi:hypothetical protein
MGKGFLAIGLLDIVVSALFGLGLGYYIQNSIRTGTALGLGWHFDRVDHPIRFWTQLFFAGCAALDQFIKAGIAMGVLDKV